MLIDLLIIKMITIEQDDFERPHTISTAYEKTHSRPAITSQTFEPPDKGQSQTAPVTPSPYAVPCIVPPPKMGPQVKEV